MRRKIVLDLRLENNPEGPFTNFVDNQGGGLVKCHRFYISLFNKVVNEGEGVKNPLNPVNVVYEWPLISI